MCPCKKHQSPGAPCTCKCKHGMTFTEHTEAENTLEDPDAGSK